MDKKSGYFFSLAALAAGAVSIPKDAGAVCGCKFHDLAPPILTRSQGPNTFVYQGSGTAGYKAELIVDDVWGFKTNTAPEVWFEYDTGASSTQTKYEVCRADFTGVNITCGPLGVNTTASAGAKEVLFNVTGTFGATNSIWDRYYAHVYWLSGTMTPKTIPGRYTYLCW